MTTLEEYAESMRREGFFAFPTKVAMPGGGTLECAGMSMRDWFASSALIGFLSAVGPHQPYSMDPPGIAAERAYEYADAMLAARNPTGARAR